MTKWWPWVRLAASVLAIVAIIAQLSLTVRNTLASTTEWGSHLPTALANFFSFFTIESNLIAAVALAIGGVWALRQTDAGTREPRRLSVLLMCASTYMIITGIVYNLLLRGIPLPQGGTVAWANEVLHVVIPLVMLADVLFAPRRRALGWGAVGIAAIYPIVWVVYTLVRADFITAPATGAPYWFPYPFLDWHEIGVGAVAGYIVGIAAAIIAVAALVVWVGRRRTRELVAA